MKHILLLLVAISTQFGHVCAQSWTPLIPWTLNLYEDTTMSFPRDTKLFSFSDMLDENGVQTMWGHLRDSGDDCDTSVTCDPNYWACHKLTHPWFGSQVITDGTTIKIRTASLDTLYFDLESTVGDTLWMLNGSTKIFGVCTLDTVQSVLGYVDDVYHFTLGHTNDLGAAIPNSNIHGKNFRLGRGLGFIDYFYLNENGVPSKLLTMIGNRQLDAGKHSFKYSDCFVFPVGSSYQIREQTYYGSGGPAAININYVKSDITNIVEDANSFQITRDVYTYTTNGTGTNTSETFETDVVNNRGKFELIHGYLEDEGSYFQSSLSRSIFCGDTVFGLSQWSSLIDTICYADSVITYYEIDPLGSTYSRSYQQYRGYFTHWSPNQGSSSISVQQQLIYLNTPDCTFGYAWYVGLEEMESELDFSFEKLINGLYQFDSGYDDVRVLTIDGKEIPDQGDFQFWLDKNSVYIVYFVKGEQSAVRKLGVLE